MSSGGAFFLAGAALRTSLGLYARHFGALTAISLVPAAARIAFFLFAQGSSGASVGLLESLVGLFRLLLFYVAFRIVWPSGLPSRSKTGSSPGDEAMPAKPVSSRPFWDEAMWHVALTAAVFLALNGLTDLLADAIFAQGGLQAAALDPDRADQLRAAARYGLKNLFLIPLWLVHLLVVIRTLFFNSVIGGGCPSSTG